MDLADQSPDVLDARVILDGGPIPRHIAIIMDGNGRWAKQRGRERLFGHMQGVERLKSCVEAAAEIGVHHLTFYTFSQENQSRPKPEVDGLMELLSHTLRTQSAVFQRQGARLSVMGEVDALSPALQSEIDLLVQETRNNQRIHVIIALNYSARWELVQAVNRLLSERHSEVSEAQLRACLCCPDVPDPELMIRTGGERRVSNFLLFQLAYSELYFTDAFWPDFDKRQFFKAILDYQGRERRFGKTSEQVL